MARFTEVENRLLEQIDDDRLRASLALIRQAAEDIWAADAPRIIKDFTDHGIAHSERLVGFVARLLEASSGCSLLAPEMYLLLAGIYLHDVGTQCDVARFSEIRARAEALGAQFGLSFTARTASDYSMPEQKAVRRNHHYLVAAWVEHAYRTGATALGPAIRTVPEDLVIDLMDVCKYHAMLPIVDCPSAFHLDPTGRKRFVAALLRFADELDIDGLRVSIETIRNFALDPRNGVYWWLHWHTTLVFSARNVILLILRLHPEDARQCGSLACDVFIRGFRDKNQPVLTVLAQNGIPIVINADSGVREYEFAERLPPEITEALQSMRGKHDVQSGRVRMGALAGTAPYDPVRVTPSVGVQGRSASNRILLVEDDPNWQDTLTRLLSGEGYEVELSVEYSEALEKVLKAEAATTGFELALCVTDLRLASETIEENYDALGLLAVCQITRLPSIVVSGYLAERLKGQSLRDRLYEQYGVLACFDKASFAGALQEFLATCTLDLLA